MAGKERLGPRASRVLGRRLREPDIGYPLLSLSSVFHSVPVSGNRTKLSLLVIQVAGPGGSMLQRSVFLSH